MNNVIAYQKEMDVRNTQIQQQKIEINRLRRELMVGVNSATYIFHWGSIIWICICTGSNWFRRC